MGRTFKDMKLAKASRKPSKKERRDLEKLQLPGRDAVRRPAEWKSAYRTLKIEE